jgi:hypothetical protein
MKRNGPNAPTAIHEPLGITYHPKKKANVIEDCLENWFTSPHDLCVNVNQELRVEVRALELLISADDHWEK